MRRRALARLAAAPLAALLTATLLAGCGTPRPVAPVDDTWFIFLEGGKALPPDKDAVAAMQRGHLDNFRRLFALGRLQAAGPLADPGRAKRGIVVVRAADAAELARHFEPDAYVRDGYMTLNARRAIARQPLHTDGIDASRIEEARIVLIGRPTATGVAAGAAAAQRHRLLRGLVDAGTLGAWYTLDDGPVAEVLLARGTDTAALQEALKPYAEAGPAVTIDIWRQWISPGVIGPREPR